MLGLFTDSYLVFNPICSAKHYTACSSRLTLFHEARYTNCSVVAQTAYIGTLELMSLNAKLSVN